MFGFKKEINYTMMINGAVTAQSFFLQMLKAEFLTMWPMFLNVRKTCPCNVYPPEPHLYMAKLGYAGVYLFFLFLLQNIDCGYSLEPPQRGGSNLYPQSMF